MVDITPMIAADRKLIQSYKAGKFQISGEFYTEPVLVFPDRVSIWNVPTSPKELETSHFAPIIGANNVDVLLFGAGEKAYFLPEEIRNFLRDTGIIVECMDTGAACRTYNVLLAEERNVAVAIYPV